MTGTTSRTVAFEARIVTDGQVSRVDAVDADEVLAALPLSEPLVCPSVRVRAEDLLPRLDGVADADGIVSAMRAAGVDLREAQLLAVALGSAASTVEIVAVDVEGQTLRGAVAVFCSPRGDVVSVPSTAVDGGMWFTLAPATPRRVALACDDLAQRRRAVR